MDTVSGQVPMNFSSLPLALPLIKDGRLRALGITSVTRSPLAPEIPPIADTVPGFNPDMWVGILAPAGTPKDVITKLHSDIQKALNSKDFRDNMTEKGLDIAPTASPAEFTKMIAAESVRWKKIIAESGASIDE
jgi:tripartite-type tricarboxylate transporter receptor subunit TctC